MMDMPAASTAAPSAEQIVSRLLADASRARLHAWGLGDYGEILALQEQLRDTRRADAIADTWLAGEHPLVATQGVRGTAADLVGAAGGLPVFKIDRGGMTTLHNPGQIVIYPIVKTRHGLLAQARLSRTLLATVRDWLAELAGVPLAMPRGRPGLFHDGRKVAAIGISIHNHVSMHGIAVNLCNDLGPWRAIVPCGEPTTRPITLSELAGRRLTPDDLLAELPGWLGRAWGYRSVERVDQV